MCCLLRVSCYCKERAEFRQTCKFILEKFNISFNNVNGYGTKTTKNQQNFNFPLSIIKMNLIIFLWILMVNELKLLSSQSFASNRNVGWKNKLSLMCEEGNLPLLLIELIKFCGMQKKVPLFMSLCKFLKAPWQCSLIKYLMLCERSLRTVLIYTEKFSFAFPFAAFKSYSFVKAQLKFYPSWKLL